MKEEEKIYKAKIVCPECGKEIEVDHRVLAYGIPFNCPECKATLKSHN